MVRRDDYWVELGRAAVLEPGLAIPYGGGLPFDEEKTVAVGTTFSPMPRWWLSAPTTPLGEPPWDESLLLLAFPVPEARRVSLWQNALFVTLSCVALTLCVLAVGPLWFSL